jgi:hypothetical protein
MKMADGFSKMAKTTAIYLARIGVEGTSGNHTSRAVKGVNNGLNGACCGRSSPAFAAPRPIRPVI